MTLSKEPQPPEHGIALFLMLISHSRFIKHYSPFCMHCLELAPVWKELAEKKSKEYPGRLNFGEVDCIANGDLCNENGVKAWPDLQWYAASLTPRDLTSKIGLSTGKVSTRMG